MTLMQLELFSFLIGENDLLKKVKHRMKFSISKKHKWYKTGMFNRCVIK